MKYFLLVIASLFSFETFSQSLEADRLALVAFYNAANGPGWINKTGWAVPGNPGDNPCGWYGVTCEAGRVTKLILEANGLAGNLPAQLGNMTNLEDLDLSHNNLTGIIPSTFTNLSKLTTMDLSDNKLVSPIPSLSGIPVGADVNISNNKFTFSGMEGNINYLDSYSPQAAIKISSSHGLPPDALYALAGSAPNNIYKWYLNGQPIFTVGEPGQLFVSEIGSYNVEVTNSLVPNLTLYGSVIVRGLPVTLVSFQGANESNQNHLTWKTTSETDNSGFEIEKSVNARAFEKIGFVDGNGDTEEDKIYHFTDLHPHRITYYRLKQLDRYDGKFEYSKIIMVKQTGSEISIYPNPAQNQLTISGMQNSEYVSFFSQNGTLVSKQLTDAKGNVEMGNLANGIYTIKIGDKTKKIVIRR
jgi:hypothetical protein